LIIHESSEIKVVTPLEGGVTTHLFKSPHFSTLIQSEKDSKVPFSGFAIESLNS